MGRSSSARGRYASRARPPCWLSSPRGTVAAGRRGPTMGETGTGPLPRLGVARWPFYYGWVSLGMAALAMVGTLPGRTQGLGLVTEPLMRDLSIDRVLFAEINLVATLVGSLFCLGIGRLIDHLGIGRLIDHNGSRLVLTVVSFCLGVVVLATSGTRGVWPLLVLITLTRGFGQSALSVASLALVGKWFSRRLSLAMGEYAAEATGATLTEALATPAFWVFALAASVYGLVASGIGLFNESILAERAFDASTYYRTLVVTALTALLGNVTGGAFASRGSLRWLLAVAMLLLTLSLAALPHVTSQAHVMAYAVVMGLAGGFVMVVFFGFWGRGYGRAHLGRIQGAAQILTVLASAVGPLLLAQCVAWTGSYAAAFYALAVVVALLGLAAVVVPLPAGAEVRAATV